MRQLITVCVPSILIVLVLCSPSPPPSDGVCFGCDFYIIEEENYNHGRYIEITYTPDSTEPKGHCKQPKQPCEEEEGCDSSGTLAIKNVSGGGLYYSTNNGASCTMIAPQASIPPTTIGDLGCGASSKHQFALKGCDLGWNEIVYWEAYCAGCKQKPL